MPQPLQVAAVRERRIALVLIASLAVPLLGATWAAVVAGWDASAWQALMQEPQTPKALAMTLWTGMGAALLSLAIAAHLLAGNFPGPRWAGMVRALGPMLAVPHAAFAIGMAFLIAPSGWLLRLLSPWATGLTAPPPWATTQDPWGLGLILVLLLKEMPFLLWAAASQLQRPDVAARWSSELQVARSMGYGPRRAWWCVLWPQLWPRLRWPVLAVLAYSLTVVDVALVIGPGSPPTLSVLAWQWLLDADPGVNAQGAAAAWLLALTVALAAALLWQLPRLALWRARWTSGQRGRASGRSWRPGGLAGRASWLLRAGLWGRGLKVSSISGSGISGSGLSGSCIPVHGLRGGGLNLLLAAYLAVLLALAVGSVAGV